MFTIYDIEVFPHEWLVVFEQNGQITRVHNDRDALMRHLSGVQILVGYNNYNYDDKIIAAILKDLDPYETSQKIISGKPFSLRLNNPLTLDVMQEINKQGLSLKEAQANMGQSIVETPIAFDLDRPLTTQELERVFRYCENDVLSTKQIFEKRESYFASKFELVKEFKLPVSEVKKTRAQLSAAILKAKKNPKIEEDRLTIRLDERFFKNSLPQTVLDFFQSLNDRFTDDADPEELEKEKLTYTLCGVEHQYGLGGLHGARENYQGKGQYMQIDISSFYPTLMINHHFISRAATQPELYKRIYKQRLQLKQAKDPKQEIYKLVLNSTFGASKSKWNLLYDPRQFNNITVYGQLILTNLIVLLEPYVELVQSNTDGIIVQYENEELIRGLCEGFSEYYQVSFDIDLIDRIAQRDVNNYVVRYQNGKIKAKGRFAYFEGGNYERNSLTIIDKALVDYYMKGIRINKTVVDCWKKGELERFQLVAKAGKFDGMAHEVFYKTLLEDNRVSEFRPIQRVNRVFATKDREVGGVYRTKKDKYSKVPYTSDHCLVWNEELSKLDKRKIDLNWYIREIEKHVF